MILYLEKNWVIVHFHVHVKKKNHGNPCIFRFLTAKKPGYRESVQLPNIVYVQFLCYDFRSRNIFYHYAAEYAMIKFVELTKVCVIVFV